MKTIGERLSYSIELKNTNPNQISVGTEIHASTIKNYLIDKGKPDSLKLDVIADFLDINREWLKNGTGSIEPAKSEVNENSSNYEVSFLDGLTSSIMFVPLVTQYAYGGYLSGFADNEYIENLPKIPFILDREYKGEYLCFEVKGDSMECDSVESINEGDILLCRNVRKDYWKSRLHINKWDFVVVTKTEGILVKRIIKHDTDTGTIILHSLNEFYEDKTLHISEVDQIFNIVDIQRKRKRK